MRHAGAPGKTEPLPPRRERRGDAGSALRRSARVCAGFRTFRLHPTVILPNGAGAKKKAANPREWTRIIEAGLTAGPGDSRSFAIAEEFA
jgi:hypothetical protein